MATTTTLIGTVAKINGSGFAIHEQDGWLNISKYAKNGDANMPNVGAKVELTLDGSGFVRKIETLDEPQAKPQPPTRPQPILSIDIRDQRIMRQAVLNTATNIIAGQHGHANADEVIALAERLEQWVLR